MCQDTKQGELSLLKLHTKPSKFQLADWVRQQGIEFGPQVKLVGFNQIGTKQIIIGPIAKICDHSDMD